MGRKLKLLGKLKERRQEKGREDIMEEGNRKGREDKRVTGRCILWEGWQERVRKEEKAGQSREAEGNETGKGEGRCIMEGGNGRVRGDKRVTGRRVSRVEWMEK